MEAHVGWGGEEVKVALEGLIRLGRKALRVYMLPSALLEVAAVVAVETPSNTTVGSGGGAALQNSVQKFPERAVETPP
jgi:hypothetical protein